MSDFPESFTIIVDYNLPKIDWINEETGLKCFSVDHNKIKAVVIENISNFTTLHSSIVTKYDDALIECDNHHPALFLILSCVNCDLNTSLNFEYVADDFHKVNYKNIGDDLCNIDWKLESL